MTNQDIHIDDGEGEAATPMAASPLRSGRRLGRSGVSEEFPMNDDCSADISGRRLFFRVEDAEVNLVASGSHNFRHPITAALVEIRALGSAILRGVSKPIVGVVARGCRSEIAGSVVGWIAVGVVQKVWDFVKANLLMNGEHNPMGTMADLADLHNDVSVNSSGARFSERVARIPPFVSGFIDKMMLRAMAPTKNASFLVQIERL